MSPRSPLRIAGALGTLLAAGCTPGDHCVLPPAPREIQDSHTSRNALDWDGTYASGSLPGERLSLYTDGRYMLEHGTGPVRRGRFVWDDGGSRIALLAGEDIAAVFFVGEGFVRQTCPAPEAGGEYRKIPPSGPDRVDQQP